MRKNYMAGDCQQFEGDCEAAHYVVQGPTFEGATITVAHHDLELALEHTEVLNQMGYYVTMKEVTHV